MVPVVRAIRVLATMVLAALVVMLVIGVAQPETGVSEKIVLLALVALCVFLAAKLSRWSAATRARLPRP